MNRQDADAIENFHRQLLEHIRHDKPGNIRVIPLVKSAVYVADSPTKSYISDQSGKKNAVLFVSNEVNPNFVRRSVHNSADAKKILGEDLGSVILTPIASGIYENLSFSIWPLERDISRNFVLRRLQKFLVTPRVFNWLEAVSRQTLCGEIGPETKEAIYLQPLAKICDQKWYPDHLRRLAEDAISHVQTDSLRPVTVLQHSDLWLGNVLLPRKQTVSARIHHGFYLIDWGGANLAGIPFLDVINFADSVCLNHTRLERELARHCRLLQCTFADAMLYLVVALANIGMRLEHFPESRYLETCDRLLNLLNGVI
jgi:thiamine kinase-like enzyme